MNTFYSNSASEAIRHRRHIRLIRSVIENAPDMTNCERGAYELRIKFWNRQRDLSLYALSEGAKFNCAKYWWVV